MIAMTLSEVPLTPASTAKNAKNAKKPVAKKRTRKR
jgi:hypothetical protein